MSPLTRPTSSQSLATQPAVMDEYADAIEAVKDLPAGIHRTIDHAVVAATLINNGNSATDWSGINLQESPVHDAATNSPGNTGGSIKGGFWSENTNGRFAYERPTALAVGDHRHLAMWVKWEWQSGFGVISANLTAKIRVSGVPNLATPFVEVPFPDIPPKTWYRIFIDISSLTNVRSVGYQQFSPAPSPPGGGQPVKIWTDDVVLLQRTEAQQAVVDTPGAVLVSPEYVPGVAEAEIGPQDDALVVDLRPGKQYITGLGGVYDVREFGPIAEDGSADVSVQINRIINDLPDGSTLRFTAGAKYLVNDQISITAKKDVTLDGQGARLFTTRRRGLTATYTVPGDAFFYLQRNHNLTIRNFEMYGHKERTFTGMQLTQDQGPTEAHGSDATVRVLNAQNEMASIPGNASDLNYRVWYSRSVDHEWYWEITLSQSGTTTEDAEIAVDLVELLGAAFPMTVVGTFHKQTVTPPQYPATQTYVIEGRPTDAQLRLRARVSVRKKKTDVNGVNIHSMLERGRCEYDSAYDNGPGVLVLDGSNYVIEDCHMEGMGTDAVQIIGQGDADGSKLNGVTVRRIVSRANSRHGIDADWGEDILFEDIRVIGCGYLGIDIEPYSLVENPPVTYGWYIDRITLRNIHFDGAFFAAIGAANWAGIENLTVENIRYGRCHQGFMLGGARKLLVANVLSDGGYTDQENNAFFADHAVIANCVLGGSIALVGDSQMQYRQHGKGAELTATSGDMLAIGVKILPPNYGNPRYVSGTTNRMIGVTLEDEVSSYLYNDASRVALFGNGSPEGSLAASPGSFYMRRDGGAGTTFYVKETGTGNTGWVGK